MLFTDPFSHVFAERECGMSTLSNGVDFVMDEVRKSGVCRGGGVSMPERSGMVVILMHALFKQARQFPSAKPMHGSSA